LPRSIRFVISGLEKGSEGADGGFSGMVISARGKLKLTFKEWPMVGPGGLAGRNVAGLAGRNEAGLVGRNESAKPCLEPERTNGGDVRPLAFWIELRRVMAEDCCSSMSLLRPWS
jgi:hypothetical protein